MNLMQQTLLEKDYLEVQIKKYEELLLLLEENEPFKFAKKTHMKWVRKRQSYLEQLEIFHRDLIQCKMTLEKYENLEEK